LFVENELYFALCAWNKNHDIFFLAIFSMTQERHLGAREALLVFGTTAPAPDYGLLPAGQVEVA